MNKILSFLYYLLKTLSLFIFLTMASAICIGMIRFLINLSIEQPVVFISLLICVPSILIITYFLWRNDNDNIRLNK